MHSYGVTADRKMGETFKRILRALVATAAVFSLSLMIGAPPCGRRSRQPVGQTPALTWGEAYGVVNRDTGYGGTFALRKQNSNGVWTFLNAHHFVDRNESLTMTR
ncbi:hypothetical protein ACIBCL_10885 [Micromonospora zamorensis]|uniref:hypothetical protein n=1 Tax=Micromonospora zamorensis TaxID=709883 RepID=UPI0037AFC70D